MLNRYLDATYCDDIRHENSGKMILIGIYSAVMYVASYPITLSKLCISIKAVTPADTPFQKLKVRIFRDDELLSEMTADSDKLNVPAISDEVFDDTNIRVQSVQFLATISPFPLTSDCMIRVKAETEGEELRCPALKVEKVETT